MLIDCPRSAPIPPCQNVLRLSLFLRMAASWKEWGELTQARKPELSEFALYGPLCLLRTVIRHTVRILVTPGRK